LNDITNILGKNHKVKRKLAFYIVQELCEMRYLEKVSPMVYKVNGCKEAEGLEDIRKLQHALKLW
jgi:hypothetical protein